MEEVLVPIVLFATVPFIVWAVSHYRYKARVKSSEVRQAMINKCETLTPGIIQSLGVKPQNRHGDFKTGLILLAIGLATILFGGAVPDEEATRIFGGLAMFPILVGIAYIGFWFFLGRKPEKD